MPQDEPLPRGLYCLGSALVHATKRHEGLTDGWKATTWNHPITGVINRDFGSYMGAITLPFSFLVGELQGRSLQVPSGMKIVDLVLIFSRVAIKIYFHKTQMFLSLDRCSCPIGFMN